MGLSVLLNRWVQLGLAIVACLALGFCEGKRYGDRSAEIKRLQAERDFLQLQLDVEAFSATFARERRVESDKLASQLREQLAVIQEEDRAAQADAAKPDPNSATPKPNSACACSLGERRARSLRDLGRSPAESAAPGRPGLQKGK